MEILKSIDGAKALLKSKIEEKRKAIMGFVRRISGGEFIDPKELLETLGTEEDLDAVREEVLRLQEIRKTARLAAQLEDFIQAREKSMADWKADDAKLAEQIGELKKLRGRLHPAYLEAGEKVRKATKAKQDLLSLLDEDTAEEIRSIESKIGAAKGDIEGLEQLIKNPSSEVNKASTKAQSLKKKIREDEDYLRSSGPFRAEDEREIKAEIANKKRELKALQSRDHDSIVKEAKRKLKDAQKELKSFEREASGLMEKVLRL